MRVLKKDAKGTYGIAAAADVQVGGRRDTTDEPEDGVEDVQHERDDGVHRPGLLDAGGEEEEQAEHAEDGAEEVVVDHGAAAARGDEVAGQCHDEERPDELYARVLLVRGHFIRRTVARET